MTAPACRLCGDCGYRLTGSLTGASAECCTCPIGVAARIKTNRDAINAYRTAGKEPITSASHAAQWDEVESALDTVRDQHRHICRGCDLALPLGSRCGGYCTRCAEEIQAQSKPVPAFKLTKWELRCLYGAALAAGSCIGLLIYSMCGGRL